MLSAPEWVGYLPGINALLNSTSAVFLVLGYRHIRARRIEQHRRCMITAFSASSLFIVGYLTLHYFIGATSFGHEGSLVRTFYFAVLLSHTVLAVFAAPLAIWTLIRAARGRFAQHARLARIALPVWLYVSLTGVIVYLMLYHLPGAEG